MSMCIAVSCSDDDPGKGGGGKSEVKVPENAVDLSAAGTANCYIVKPGGTVVFDAQYKGNSTTESIGNPVTAELVWQDAKNLIQDIYYVSKEKKIVAVTAPGTSGNAVVADGEILWSWHLWIADYDPAASLYTTPANASGTTWTFMDRNVGATTNAPDSFDCHGMIYQWGRKDPFTSAGTFTIINEDYSYQVDGERPIYNILNEELPKMRTRAEYHGTIAKSLRNPAVFYAMTYNFTGETDEYGQEIVLNDYRTKDWTDVSDDDYWGGVSGKKTIYDPCPPGWRVPDRRAFAEADLRSASAAAGYRLLYFSAASATALYPLGGHRDAGGFTDNGKSGYVWTNAPAQYRSGTNYYKHYAAALGLSAAGIEPLARMPREKALPVRCVRE